MSIRIKLLALISFTLITFLGIGLYAMSVYHSTLVDEQNIRQDTNQAIELAHQTDAQFHLQLNAWKNVLLRGTEASKYHDYLQHYYQQERETRKEIKQLQEWLSQSESTRELGVNLLNAHLEAGLKFREALRVFNATEVNPGQVTDLYVAGAEDTTSMLLQKITQQLKHDRDVQVDSLTEHRRDQENLLITLVIATVLFSFIAFLWLMDKNIVRPAAQAAQLTDIMRHAERVTKLGAWDWDSRSKTHYWSNGMYVLLGLDRQQKPSLDLFLDSISEHDREHVQDLVEHAQKNKLPFELEIRIPRPGEKERVALLRGQVTRINNSDHVRLTSILYDITERMQAREQVIQSETKFRTLFETAGDAIVVIKDAQFIDCNPQALSLYGCTRDELLGKTPMDFSTPTQYDGRESNVAAPEMIQTAMTKGSTHTFPWRHCKLDGTPFDAEVTLNRIEIDGEPCIQGIVRDVTLRKRTEEAIKNIATGVSSMTGEDFFNQLVIYLSKLFDTKYAFIGLLDSTNPKLINTLAVSVEGVISDNINYSLDSTPCANVIGQGTCTHASGVQAEFPDDLLLQEMGVDSYIGTPLFDATGNPLGLIVLLHDKPLQQIEWIGEILQIFASRAAAELERVRAEKVSLKQSEQLRASIESMPGYYYMYNADGTLAFSNQAFLDFYGISQKDFGHFRIATNIHPDDLHRVNDAIETIMETGETHILELRTTGKDGQYRPFLATGARVILDGQPHLVGSAIDISDRVRAEHDLFIKERAMEAAAEGMMLTAFGEGNPIVYANQAMIDLTGYSREELLGANPNIFQGPDTDPAAVEKLRDAIRQQQSCHIEILNYRKDGSTFWNELTITPVTNETGEVTHFIGTQLDVTERRQTERALRESQKMEAVGQLAGGIAHDFNNQLGIVIGYLDFLRGHLANEDKASKWVDTATQATLRCMDLTRQLLTFARNKVKETTVADLNQELAKMDTLITRAITPAITVQTFPDENLWPVAIDPGEFQDAILNLVINARDAMPQGGQLIIETTNKLVDVQYASLNPDLTPGEYVQVMVSDSGEGMDKAVAERVFEPFFTTKSEGKGTGLGLAMVYSFAKRYKGIIKVYSEPRVGTTFRLYLPRVEASPDIETGKATLASPPKGSETVLIVDDEVDLLRLAEQYLQHLGYRTLTVDNPQDALQMLAQHSDIDLLFSDVVMPGNMNGYALAEQAVKSKPKLKVLLTSGFTSNAIAVNGQAKFTANILHKPYRQYDLAQRVRDVLDQRLQT